MRDSRTSASPLAAIWKGFAADLRVYRRASTALRHSARRLPRPGEGARQRALLAQQSLHHHARLATGGDPLFCLSHRHYLARGLTRQQRLDAALCHYRELDQKLPPALLHALLDPVGLQLWQREADGHLFTLTATAAADAAHEGGLSVALRIDGGVLSILSALLIPARLAGLDGDHPTLLVSRKQTSQDRDARNAFDRAFDRGNPAGMSLAGLSALAEVLGQTQMVGLCGHRHPSWTADRASSFENSYCRFWETLGGRQVNGFGWLIDLPLHYTPVEGMTAARRARALRRRRHQTEAESVARNTLRSIAGQPDSAPGS